MNALSVSRSSLSKAMATQSAMRSMLGGASLSRPCRSIRMMASPEESTQTPPKESTEELPPWVRRENERKLQAEAPKELPWGLYLLFSCFCAIACVGSIFEYSYGNALFGVIQPDSFLWAPILLSFAVTGLPTAGYLFFKGITAFNEDADRQNKLDGYN